MKIITKPSEIDQTLVQLMEKYKKYYIATAWASLGSRASTKLLKNKERIQKMIVGTHFYQTHPEFINEFIESLQVKFILKPSGVYHPKAYLFVNSPKNWECLIGSANFTKSALSKNDEIVVHITSSDSNADEIYTSTLETIEQYWKNSNSITQEQYNNYRNIWEKNKTKIERLGGNYGELESKKSLIDSNLFSMGWSEYYELIEHDDIRLDILRQVREYFIQNPHFKNMDTITRKNVAGVYPEHNDPFGGCFGGMSGAGVFHNRINKNDPLISQALDEIPLHGNISKSHYNKYIELFKKSFPNGRDGVGVATRLLAMKRPDYFICLNKGNRSKLCEEFGLRKKTFYDEYWNEIIERICDSVWWLSEKPSNDLELSAWQGRVAMLDVIFYKN